MLSGRWRVITTPVSYAPFCGIYSSKCSTCFFEILKAPVVCLYWGENSTIQGLMFWGRNFPFYTRNLKKKLVLWINVMALYGILYCGSMDTRYIFVHTYHLVETPCFLVNGRTWTYRDVSNFFFSLYLTNGKIFGKNNSYRILNVHWFSLYLLSVTSTIPRRIHQYIIINVRTTSSKVYIILVWFQSDLNFLDIFLKKKTLKYEISWKFLYWHPNCFRVVGQTLRR